MAADDHDDQATDRADYALGDFAHLAEQYSNDTLVTYVYRIDEDGRKLPGGVGPQVYLEKVMGVPELDKIRERWGGGCYEFMIQTTRGKMIQKRRMLVAGPARNAFETPAPAPAPAPATAPALDGDRLATMVSESIARAIAPLLERRAEPRESSFEQTLALAERMATRMAPPPQDQATLVKSSLDMLEKGINLARRETGSGRSLGDAVVEAMPQLVEVIGRVIDSRERNAAPGAAPAAPAPPGPDLANLVLAGMVARAVANGRTAEDLAAVIEVQLNERELAQLVGIAPGFVAGNLRRFAGQFPALSDPSLEPLVAETLRLLSETDDGPQGIHDARGSE